MNEAAMDGFNWKEGLTYGGLGFVVLGLVGWWLTSMVKQAVNRSAKESTFDDRAALLIKSVESAYEKLLVMNTTTIEALRLRLEQVQDKLAQAYATIATMQMEHSKALTQTVGDVRRENLQSTQRLHDRLDKAEEAQRRTEEAHKACESQMSMLQRMLEQKSASGSAITVTPGAGGSLQVSAGG